MLNPTLSPTPSRNKTSTAALVEAFPRLQELIRLTERAMAARDAEAIVARLAAGIRPLITNQAGVLPASFLEAHEVQQRRIELHHDPVLGFQILAQVWAPGQGTAVHDHAGSWGIEAVWSGSLLVADFDLLDQAGDGSVRLRPRTATHLQPGEFATVTPRENLHLCRNPSPRDVALSLHIYGTALDEVTEYARIGESDWYQPTRRWLPLESSQRDTRRGPEGSH